MTVEVPLTRGLVALIDDEDADRVLAIKWHVMPKTGTDDFYARNGRGGTKPTLHGVRYLHRFIINAPSDSLVDHINGRGLDCRRDNLRLANSSLNCVNRAAPQRALPRGVYLLPSGRYRAQITVNRKDYSLGHFGTVGEASAAYNSAAVNAFGSFARVST